MYTPGRTGSVSSFSVRPMQCVPAPRAQQMIIRSVAHAGRTHRWGLHPAERLVRLRLPGLDDGPLFGHAPPHGAAASLRAPPADGLGPRAREGRTVIFDERADALRLRLLKPWNFKVYLWRKLPLAACAGLTLRQLDESGG